MLTAMSSLRDAQTLKEFWENLGAIFAHREDGTLDISYSGSLLFDENAKRDLAAFVADNRRALHALVICQDDLAIGRFEFVQQERQRGRYRED